MDKLQVIQAAEEKGGKNRREAIEKLMNERETLYKKADFTVDSSELSPLQVVETILRYLKSRGMLHA